MSDHSNDNVIETNRDYFLTTTTIRTSVALDTLFRILRERRTSGDLCFHLNKGGVRRIELSERKPLTEKKADEVRDVLRMELESHFEENL